MITENSSIRVPQSPGHHRSSSNQRIGPKGQRRLKRKKKVTTRKMTVESVGMQTNLRRVLENDFRLFCYKSIIISLHPDNHKANEPSLQIRSKVVTKKIIIVHSFSHEGGRWPPNSHDLNLLDYSIWKNFVHLMHGIV